MEANIDKDLKNFMEVLMVNGVDEGIIFYRDDCIWLEQNVVISKLNGNDSTLIVSFNLSINPSYILSVTSGSFKT